MTKKLDFALSKIGELLEKRPLFVFSITVILILTMWVSGLRLAVLALEASTAVLTAALIFTGKIDRVIAVLTIVAIGAANICAERALLKTEYIERSLCDKSVYAVGRVVSEPTVSGNFTALYFDAKHVYFGDERYDNVKLYLRCGADEKISYGDELKIDVHLSKPTFSGYSMENVIHAKGARLMGSDVHVRESKSPGFPWGVIAFIRQCIRSCADRLSGSARALFTGITMGDKTYFDENLTGDLAAAGISHIACVSGLHVTLIGYGVYKALKRLNVNMATVLSIFVSFLFSAVAGAAPSSVRSAIMFTIFILSERFMRENDSVNSLLFSAVLLMCSNPYVIYDLGFLLSYSSVAGITFFARPIERGLSFMPTLAKGPVSATLAAQIFTLPVSLTYFNTCAVYFIPANLIVSLIFPIALPLCFISVLLMWVPIVSEALLGACTFLLTCLAAAARLMRSLPFGAVELERVGWPVIICYLMLVFSLIFSRKTGTGRAAASLLVCTVILTVSGLYGGDDVTEWQMADKTYVFEAADSRIIMTEDSPDYISSLLIRRGGTHCDRLVVGKWSDQAQIGKLAVLTDAKAICLPRSCGYAPSLRGLDVKIVYYSDEDEGFSDLYTYTRNNFL